MSVAGIDRAADDDLELVRRCLAGDDEAWRRLVQSHRPAMIDLARRIVPQFAEDVVDAAIADVWKRRKLARFEARSSLATWLGAIAINAALNAARAFSTRGRTAPGMRRVPEAAVPASPDRDESSLAQILNEAIAALPADAKLLVLMYYEQGLTLDQVAPMFNRSKSTLSRNLQQARDRIRDEAERLARRRFGTTLSALRAGADLGLLDVDLRIACAGARETLDRQVSNS